VTGRIYTVPSGVPFLKALAQGLLAMHQSTDDAFALAAVTVLLPTRRAVRGLEEAFLDSLGPGEDAALLLPRMRPLGDVDEEELATGEDANGFGAEFELGLPPAVSSLRRQVSLAELIMEKGPRGAVAFAEALGWARSLAHFLDEVVIEEVGLERLEAVIPEDLAAHFQSSRDFISLLNKDWPERLAEQGYIEAAERRRTLMEAQARSWAAHPPGPIYVAGSTGSIKATARLMKAVRDLPQGTIVLPGLDRMLETSAWEKIEESHPQWGLKNLLRDLEVAREDVAEWPYAEGLAAAPRARLAFLAEVLRPAPTTDSWATTLTGFAAEEALSGLRLVTARDSEEEARVIALAMRETLTRPGESAALVTPDRRLARRVSAELKRWGVEVDDSAGVPLKDVAPLALMRLALQAVADDLAPVPLLALLKHRLAQFDESEAAHARAVSRLERLALRGPRPAPGIEGLKARLDDVDAGWREREHTEEEEARFAARLTQGRGLVGRIEHALAPLIDLAKADALPQDWASALVRTGESFAGSALWSGDAGEAAAGLVRELMSEATLGARLSLDDFVELFEAATSGRSVRPRAGFHPRLSIWGALEARLQSADLVILGGLNEGIWPARAEVDPWANRPMRKAMGLSQPERRIGLSAHDFQELAAARNVLLTYAQKVDGSPALPSRWVMRLENFLKGQKAKGRVAVATLGIWAKDLDAARDFKPVERPRPMPAVDLRPNRLSITEIKTLRRDPYAIYAKHVLKFRPLDPIDEDATAKERGILVHDIMEAFVRAYPDALPEDALERLLAFGEERLSAKDLDAETKALWRARLARAGEKLIEWESEQRKTARPLSMEAAGETEFKGLGCPFTLTGRIDRVDSDRASGALTVIDYKTGRVPSEKQIKYMLDPQLPLGALMIQRGGIEDVAAAPVERLLYLQVGGASGPIDDRDVTEDVAALVAKTENELKKLLRRYEDPAMPYWSWAIQERESDVGDYDLLARVKEWRIEDGEAE
jgi:ATP-dependent helicase/nuclease subunit B